MADFWDTRCQQTYINVRMLRTKQTMEIYMVSLLPPSVLPKSLNSPGCVLAVLTNNTHQ